MNASSLPGNLKGNFHVRVFNVAFGDARNLCEKAKDRCEIRRQALKLRYWPENHPENESGQILDVNWSWIKALSGEKIDELRIGDTIGGHDNLRIIFFVDMEVSKQLPDENEHIPTIWILYVMQKKRDDFTKAQLKIMASRKKLVVKRFYSRD